MSIEVITTDMNEPITLHGYEELDSRHIGLILRDGDDDLFIVVRNKAGSPNLLMIRQELILSGGIRFPLIAVPKGTTIRITQD